MNRMVVLDRFHNAMPAPLAVKSNVSPLAALLVLKNGSEFGVLIRWMVKAHLFLVSQESYATAGRVSLLPILTVVTDG